MQRRSKIFILVLLLIFALIIWSVIKLPSQPTPPTVHPGQAAVLSIRGPVLFKFNATSDWAFLEVNTLLTSNAIIQTASRSSVDLMVGSNRKVRITESTKVALAEILP